MTGQDYVSATIHPVLAMPQPAGNIALTLITCAVMSLLAWGIVRAKANGGVLLLVIAASLACSQMEAWAEYMAMNYHPEIGGRVAYVAWEMPVPVHIVLAYALYFGAPGYGLLLLIQRGARTTIFWWTLFCGLCMVVAIADIVALHSGIWTYYGAQPFVVARFPLTWMLCNGAAMFAFAGIVHACLSRLSGVQRAWTVLIAPIGLSMAWAGVCLPLANALHGNAGVWIIRVRSLRLGRG